LRALQAWNLPRVEWEKYCKRTGKQQCFSVFARYNPGICILLQMPVLLAIYLRPVFATPRQADE